MAGCFGPSMEDKYFENKTLAYLDNNNLDECVFGEDDVCEYCGSSSLECNGFEIFCRDCEMYN